jgi:hypothetical protein
MFIRVYAVVLGCLTASTTHAQILPLTPVTRPLSTDTVLITFERTDDTVFNSVQIKIEGGTLYLMEGNRVSDEELDDQTIGDFIREFTDEHEGLILKTTFPELRASSFAEGVYGFDEGEETFSIKAREARPSIAIGGGIGFVANEVAPRQAGSTLMRNAGLALDVVAVKPFDWVTLRARVGFHSAEPVPTVEGTDSTDAEGGSSGQQQSTSPTSPRSVVETAQAIAVGFSVDAPLPYFSSWSRQMHVSVGLDASQYWASPEVFTFPDSIRVSGRQVPISSVFSDAQIQRARTQMDRILPLGMVTGGVRLLFGSPDEYVFYIVSDVGWRNYLSRRLGVRYRRLEGDTVATPIDLSPDVTIRNERVARYSLGIRLTGGVDFKVDVTRPFARGEFEPAAPTVLRLMIGTPGLSFGN